MFNCAVNLLLQYPDEEVDSRNEKRWRKGVEELVEKFHGVENEAPITKKKSNDFSELRKSIVGKQKGSRNAASQSISEPPINFQIAIDKLQLVHLLIRNLNTDALPKSLTFCMMHGTISSARERILVKDAEEELKGLMISARFSNQHTQAAFLSYILCTLATKEASFHKLDPNTNIAALDLADAEEIRLMNLVVSVRYNFMSYF